MDKTRIVETIKQLRIESNYNKEEVAGLVGISPATLRAYENGDVLVPLDILYLILQIYGINVTKIWEIFDTYL